MIHALVLGLVIAIVLIILIQKVTSGFTAAECDARYTKDYTACGSAYEKAKKRCGNGRNATSCKQKALRARESCIDAAASAKIACLGPAAASGDVVATQQLQAAQRRDERRSSPVAVTGAALVTPGATFAPSPPQGGASTPALVAAPRQAPAPTTVAAPAPRQAPAPTTVAVPAPVLAVPAPIMVAAPAPRRAPAAAPRQAPAPPPVPAPAEAPSALQMAACPPGDTSTVFGGQQDGEALAGGSALSLRAGDQVCSKPAPGAYQCDFGAGYAYHGGASVSECIKPRTA